MPQVRLIDCHVHLQDPALLSRLPEVLERARGAGVLCYVSNGSEPSDWPEVERVAAEHPGVVPFLGLHPWYVSEAGDYWLEDLSSRLERSRAGVGEIGLDRWKEGLEEKAQEEAFRAQLDLARRLRRPAAIHCLKAWGWLMDVLRSEPPLTAPFLLHAFGGPAELIHPLADRGAYFSFSGDVLDERKTRRRIALRYVPSDRLLLETDAPDILVPPHHRSVPTFRDEEGRERSEPASLADVLRGAARLLGQSEEALSMRVWENARRFLGDLFPADLAG